MLPCEVDQNGEASVAHLAGATVAVGSPGLAGPAWLVLRPENVRVELGDSAGPGLPAVVRDVAYRGVGFSYQLDVQGLDDPVKAEVPAGPEHPFDVGAAVQIGWSRDAPIVLPREV